MSTLKKLFALSGNVCAFPSCTQEMVANDGNLIGEICHIEAANLTGPRYNPLQSDNERRSFENLILLCGTHHKVTDNEAEYTVQILKKMKYEHELQFRNKHFTLSHSQLMRVMESISETVNRLSEVANEIRTDFKNNKDHGLQTQFEVSYIVVDTRRNSFAKNLILIGELLNVQLFESSDMIPFTPPRDFQKLNNEEKIVIIAPSGYGKSRLVYEVVRDRISKIDQIYVINPRQKISQQIKRASIRSLVDELKENAMIVWDNFPDDLTELDGRNIETVLNVVSSSRVRNLLMTLKPQYFQIHGPTVDRIPELFSFRIMYSREDIKNILESYGREIRTYKAVLPELKRQIVETSEALWQKDPSPMAVRIFYQQCLKNDRGVSYIIHNLELPVDYFRKQFRIIQRNSQYEKELFFLYSLKLCYMLGQERTRESICSLAKKVFYRECPESPLRNLDLWIYLDDDSSEYSIHDLPRNIIDFDEDSISQVLNYLVSILEYLDPSAEAGQFIGSNISHIKENERIAFIQRSFRIHGISRLTYGLAEGMATNYAVLGKGAREQLLNYARINTHFGDNLFSELGKNFPNLPKEIGKEVLKSCIDESDTLDMFMMYLNFDQLDRLTQEKLFKRCISDKKLPWRLGVCIGRTLNRLDDDTRRMAYGNIRQYPEFAYELGSSVAPIFNDLEESVKEEVIGHVFDNQSFAAAFIGRINISRVNPELRNRILRTARTDRNYALGLCHNQYMVRDPSDLEVLFTLAKRYNLHKMLGQTIGFEFGYLSARMQGRVLRSVTSNRDFAEGFSFAFFQHFSSLSRSIQRKMLTFAKKSAFFSSLMVNDIGLDFGRLEEDVQEGILQLLGEVPIRVSKDEEPGFTFGLIFDELSSQVQEKLLYFANVNDRFAHGLGYGLGMSNGVVKMNIYQRLFDIGNHRETFASGLGKGLGYQFDVLVHITNIEVLKSILNYTRENNAFATSFGEELANRFMKLPPEMCEELLNVANDNAAFAEALLRHVSLERMSRSLSQKVRKLRNKLSKV